MNIEWTRITISTLQIHQSYVDMLQNQEYSWDTMDSSTGTHIGTYIGTHIGTHILMVIAIINAYAMMEQSDSQPLHCISNIL